MSRASSIYLAAAAEHLVCADLLLSGVMASLAARGAHYDVIADVDGTLLRIEVKATGRVRSRPGRPGAPGIYNFATTRNHRPPLRSEQGARVLPYTDEQADIFALVAMDVRQIAYLPIFGQPPQRIHLHPADALPFLRRGENQRKLLTDFPFEKAVAAIRARRGVADKTPAAIGSLL